MRRRRRWRANEQRNVPFNFHSCLVSHSNKVGVPGKTEGVIFCPVPVEVTYFEPERVGVELLNKTIFMESKGRVAPTVPDLERIRDMLAGVENVADRLLQYVEDVMVSVGEEKEKEKERVLVRKVVKTNTILVLFSGWQDSSKQCCWSTANGDSFHGIPD